jgi:hypothetical protein
MRMIKLVLAAGIALVFASGSAYAIKVQQKAEATGDPADVWAIAGEAFCTIDSWHPAVAECEETKEGDAVIRTLTLQDGGKIKEKLTGTDDLSYTYEITEGPLPVTNYSSKLWVEPGDKPGTSVIYWESEFDAADGTSDEEAEGIITGILSDGVKGIAKNAEAAQ